MRPNDPDRVYVANGELATVVAVFPNYIVAKLTCPDRLIRIPNTGEFDDKKEGDKQSSNSWELGYAISVHRSQGSEWPIIVVMFDSYGGAVRLVDKHWVYTAISRAKKLCVCIGASRLAVDACRKSHMFHRKTLLVETIERLRLHGLAAAWEGDLLEV